MFVLGRADLVGSPIRRVRQEHRAKGVDGWLDAGQTYFTLESGVSFVIPHSGADRFEAIDVPRGAKDLSDKELVGQSILEVFRRLYDGEDSGESVVLQLSNNTFVTEKIVAPHGTGAVGLYVYSRAEWEGMSDEEWEMVPFWNRRSLTR